MNLKAHEALMVLLVYFFQVSSSLNFHAFSTCIVFLTSPTVFLFLFIDCDCECVFTLLWGVYPLAFIDHRIRWRTGNLP